MPYLKAVANDKLIYRVPQPAVGSVIDADYTESYNFCSLQKMYN